MIKQSGWRWLVAVLIPCGVLAGLFQFNVVHLAYEANTVLYYKGEIKTLPQPAEARVVRGSAPGTIRLISQGSTPSRALWAAESATAKLTRDSVDLKKREFRKTAEPLKRRQVLLSTQLTQLEQDRQRATRGSRSAWTPEMAARLNQERSRFHTLVANFPTHTDIPVLSQDIKKLEAAQRGQARIDPARVAQLAKQVAEARAESSFITLKLRAMDQAEKTLQPDWKLRQAARRSRWPVGVPGWPIAAGSVVTSFGFAWLLLKKKPRRVESPSGLFKPAPAAAVPITQIPLALSTEDAGPLPDDPQSRKAAQLFEQWLTLVKRVYAPGPEAPKDIFVNAEPMVKETVEFLGTGQDTMTRHLARVVVPGDLYSHVARTVLMALMGAWEAGATPDQQKGMTLAALFHDLAVAPRPADAWHEIGSEVGRLSSSFLKKIPGIPAPLLTLTEEILIAMDEYPMETWQNVPRNQAVASFAKLLGHIDRFDKVLQKQKTRLNRRIATS